MTGLFSQLHVAARALGVHRAAQATASHNVENASTPGYARQRAELTAALPATLEGVGYIGRGVALQGITQVRDRFLDAQVPAALAHASASAAEASVATAITTLDPDDPHGLPATFGQFYAAVRELSRDPSSASARRGMVGAADALSRSFHRAASDLAGARAAADEQLATHATRATELAARVAALNADIRGAQASGAAPHDLMDARLQAAEELVSLTGATLQTQGLDLNVQLGAHGLVVGDTSAVLETRADAANGGHLALHVRRIDGSTSEAGTVGGALGGVLRGRDAVLGASEARLDQLAFEFAQSFNTVHRGGIALDGTTGHDFFAPDVVAGAAARFRVDPGITNNPDLIGASGTGAAGDNTTTLAMLATEHAPLASGMNPQAALSAIIDDFGAAARTALASSEADAASAAHIVSLRDSASGVSIDEEMVEMMKAQRAFEAVTKVLQTTDQMLQTVLDLR